MLEFGKALVPFLEELFKEFILQFISDKKVKYDEKKVKEKIQSKINDFNRKFDNTILDTYAFQQFFESTDVNVKLYDRIFKTYSQDSEEINKFKAEIAQEAFQFVNEHYKKMGKKEVENKNIFFEYFNVLIVDLINIRNDLLSLEQSFQTAILTEEIRKLKEETKKTRFDATIKDKQCFSILKDYLDFSEMKTIISYGDPKAAQIISLTSDGFQMKVNTCKAPTASIENKEFIMALLKFIPSENWVEFWKANYYLSVDISAVQGIKAVQLEIKDTNKDKFVNEKIAILETGTHIEFLLSSLARQAAWEEISEICFTVFINNNYITEETSNFNVKNFYLIPVS